MRFSVVTPISDRPEAFDLLAMCMARQKFQGNAEWVVVDDSHVPVTVAESPENLEVRIVREQPTDGEMTLARNLLGGYEHVRSDTVVFCESQSWYRPDYLETMVEAVERKGITRAGAPYYRVYMLWRNTWIEETERPPKGAPLCRTAIRGSRIKSLHQQLLRDCQKNKGSGSCDTPLWAGAVPEKAFVVDRGLTAVFMGIKGKVRYSSRGVHPKVTAQKRWGNVETSDHEGRTLVEWIGKEDAVKYLALGDGHGRI